jgi:dihydrofolate reductase
MRLTLTQFVTLDGVYQGPGAADEDTTDSFTRGGWMVPHMDQTFIAVAAGWLERAGALLLGRRTYEAFAMAWPQNTDPDDPFAGRMNSLPKYVASHTITETPWTPATVLGGDVVAQVAELKTQAGDELQLHGSARLAQSLLAAGLIDEIRLVITPTVLGQGRRLFPDDGPPLGMRVAESTTTPGGLTILVLEATGPAAFATYEGVSSVDD